MSERAGKRWWIALVACWSLASAAAAQPAPPAADSPAVRAALALPRTEPRHYVQTAIVLLDLGATEEATQLVQELVAKDPSAAQLAELVSQVGTGQLSRLAVALPEAAPLARRAIAAAAAAATSPERLGRLVERLAGEREQAVDAIRELRATGRKGAEFAAQQLREAADPTVRARLREALVALDPISRPLIYEATLSEDPNVSNEGAYALGRLAELNRIRSRLPAALVVGAALRGSEPARWAYSRLADEPLTIPSAERLLDTAIEELLAGGRLFSDERDDSPGVSRRLAAQLARERWRLDERVESTGRLAAALMLEAGDRTANEIAARVGVSGVLQAALDNGLHLAAVRAATALGNEGGESVVATRGLRPAPLVAALESPHPAVRYTAAKALVAINPQQPYSGSSLLIDTLLYFARSQGEQRAVVASPQLARAAATAGWLAAGGYAATPANRGAAAVDAAAESPDTQLVLIDQSLSLPGARETLFRLRRRPQTALVPVGLLAAEGRLADAQRLAEEHDAVVAVARPHSVDATVSLAERLAELRPDGWPDASVRLRWASEAREAIARLVDQGPDFYAWSRRSEDLVGVLGFGSDGQSLSTLAQLGTPESQARLVDAATLAARGVDDRRAAADAFAKSVDRFGVLLTTDQIREQYVRYNASETAPEATQQVLGRVLDTIEGARR